MRLEVPDEIKLDFQALSGEYLILNTYRFGNFTPNDGFILSGGTYYYIIQIQTKVVEEKYPLHIIVIQRLEEEELSDDLELEPIIEGTFGKLHWFYQEVEDIEIKQKKIGTVSVDCALMMEFDHKPAFIYPDMELFNSSALELDVDQILECIHTNHLKQVEGERDV